MYIFSDKEFKSEDEVIDAFTAVEREILFDCLEIWDISTATNLDKRKLSTMIQGLI